MVDFLQMLVELPEAVSESARSRERRNVEAQRLIAPPPAGTPLLVSLALAFEHTGIYLGGSPLTRFINGTPDGAWQVRNGTRIFAACDVCTRRPLASARPLETARAAIEAGSNRMGYDFAQLNCHLFTAACVLGIPPGTRQFRSLFDGRVASIGKLERILAKTLNRGKGICWCAVRRDKERFNYSLSPGKRIRLAVESVLK